MGNRGKILNRYWKVDLKGTILSDYAYISEVSSESAKRKVKKSLTEMNGKDSTLVPKLSAKRVPFQDIVKDLRATCGRDYPKALGTLEEGSPIFDFCEFL